MLHTIIEKNTYMDSVELMKLSKELSHFSGITKATVMMGTAANKEIMEKGGFGSERLAAAKANDMVCLLYTSLCRLWQFFWGRHQAGNGGQLLP